MNIQKIEINPNQYVWVDINAEIKKNDWFFPTTRQIAGGNTPRKCTGIGTNAWNGNILSDDTDEKGYDLSNVAKIIAASPELKLKGIPSYARYKALEYSKLIEKEVKNESDYDWCLGAYQGFEAGYKVAEKDLFTKEDVRKAIVLSATSPTDNLIDRCDEIIERLKQTKS